jgi:PAS domain S-box-containing protein
MRHYRPPRQSRTARRYARPAPGRRTKPATGPAVESASLTAPTVDLTAITPLFRTGVADKVPLILFSYDLASRRLLHCNRHCYTVLGYTSQELLEMKHGLMSTILHPSSLLQYQKTDPQLLLASDQVLTWDCHVRHHDGNWRWLRVRARASAHNTQGKVTQIMGSAEDITRHRAAVDELRQNRHLLRQALDLVPNFIHIFDLKENRNLYSNGRVESLLGYSPEEILTWGNTLSERVFDPAELVRVRDMLREVATLQDGETRVLEYSIRHRDGTLRWLRSTQAPYQRDADGKVRSIIGVAEDITQRHEADTETKAATQRLAEKHRLLQAVIDAIPHPVRLRDGNGNFYLANQATADLYGMTPEALVRDGVLASSASNWVDFARYLAADRQVLATRQDLTMEEPFTLASGEVLWFNSTRRFFEWTDGTELVLGVHSNITELKRAQLALEASKEAAEENARAKQDFLANMSHEIRTPLHGIIGLTEVLAKTTLSNSQHDYLRLLGESAEHLLNVMNDVLTTARLGAGKLQPEVLSFTPHELLAGCAALLRPRAREKGLRLRVEAPTIPAILGDAHRLRQVLLNLVSNAVKFTEKGQIRLRCRLLPSPTGEADHRVWLRFTVTDTGIGISPEALSRVFEPFTQATASTDREYGGTGLGLSISKGLVELMGGSLEVVSKPGWGSKFCFTLAFEPQKLVVPAQLPAPAEPLAQPHATGRVLLVEDNVVNSLLAETILRNWGWEVTVAMSGSAAIQLFEQRPFDIVLMDIQMPGMDGETAAQILREHPDPDRATTPIIALTARAQPGEADRLQASGFNGYLAKPFREEQLLEVLQTVLDANANESSKSHSQPDTMPSTLPLYDLTNVRQLVRHDEAIVRRLAWAFIETTPAILTALDNALVNADWQAVSDAAHHLKSSLDGLGVERLRNTIRELEEFSQQDPAPGQAAPLVAQVRSITEQVMAELRNEFPE